MASGPHAKCNIRPGENTKHSFKYSFLEDFATPEKVIACQTCALGGILVC